MRTRKPHCPDCGAVLDSRAGCYNCALAAQCRAHGIEEPVPEYSFDARPDGTPDYRWDFAWPHVRLFLEIQGAIWTRGAHGRGSGIKRDMQKLNTATRAGWFTVAFEPSEIVNGTACAFIAEVVRFLEHKGY